MSISSTRMLSKSKASTVDTAYGLVDPNIPLKPDDPRHVDLSSARGGENLPNSITSHICRTSADTWHYQLVTGYPGCGKSTELKRLQGLLDQAGFISVYVDIEETLDLSDIEYLDVLVAIAHALDETARDRELRVSDKLVEVVDEWFAETVLTKEEQRDVERALKTEYGVGSDVKMLLFAVMKAVFTGQIRSGSKTRKETSRKLEQRLPVLIERLNELVDAVTVHAAKKGHKRLVVILDNLEKMNRTVTGDNQTNPSLLFVEHAEQLKALNCHIVYTVPISLTFDYNLKTLYDEVDVVPMVKVTEEDGQTSCKTGHDLLFKVVAQRIDVDALFDHPTTLHELVAASGGALRDLMHLVRSACSYSNSMIDKVAAQQAVDRMVRHYDRLINEEDLALLARVHRERHLPHSEALLRLMDNGLVLAYLNRKPWMDVHPAVAKSWLFRNHFRLEKA